MSEEVDFEQAWLTKFSTLLREVAGDEIREEVVRGSASLSSASSGDEVIHWTRGAMERLDTLVDERRCRAILTGCACQYPRAALQAARKAYEETGDIDLAHRMLQEQFEAFLEETLGLDEELIEDMVNRGWGSAGVKEGSRIIATKIPKSGNLIEYLREEDPAKRRQLYCHCPRVRDALKFSVSISPTYCYCGGGFYKGIWEEILQQPVEVELLESVLQGDDVCKFAIILPSGA
jgi:hypothetical protein